MNDRMRAIAVLREAKQILSDRLTERVLEAAEEILADARGESYMNDIESVYEQVGMKLAHVNQMLANLPAEPEAPAKPTAATTAEKQATPPAGGGEMERPPQASRTMALPAPPHPPARALPPPKATAPLIPLSQRQRELPSRGETFQSFARQVQAGNFLAAGRLLAVLFELPEARAITCAAVFADRLQTDQDFLRRAAELRCEIEEGSVSRAVVLLHDCFGLTASEALAVLHSLRKREQLEY